MKKFNSVKKSVKKKFIMHKKKIISVKKIHFAKKIILEENVLFRNKSHSLKNKFYFQFRFATNEQV